MFSKKKIRLITSFFVVVFSIVAIIVSDSSPKFSSPFKAPAVTEESEQTTTDEQVMGSSSSEISVSPSVIGESSNNEDSTQEEGLVEFEQTGFKVIKVVDGDTLDVEIDGKIERLRLIGIDTPETVDPRKKVQCFGREASNKAKELLEGRFVSLESDGTQGERDKYKRLLRYVFLPDGANFNLFMIAEGFAHEYTYDQPYKYQAEFKDAERSARENNKGLWNINSCPN